MILALGFAAWTLALVSCNAILGIEDRSPREREAGLDAASGADVDAGGADGSEGDAGQAARYRSVVLGDGPIVYLRLAEKEGETIARNEIAGGVQGTYPPSGVDLGVEGRFGDPSDTAVHFRGDRGIQMADSERLTFGKTSPYSVEVWVRPAADNPIFGYLVDHESFDGAGKSGWTLIVGNQAVYFERWLNGVNRGAVSYDQPLAVGQWHHVVGTYDGTAEVLYVDGEEKSTTPTTAELGVDAGTGWSIGAQNCVCTMSDFIGDVDVVAIYEKALRTDQVKAHYDAGRPSP